MLSWTQTFSHFTITERHNHTPWSTFVSLEITIRGKGLSCIKTVFFKNSKDTARFELELAVFVHFK